MSKIVKLDRTNMPVNRKHISLITEEPELIILDNGLKTFIINEGDIDYSRIDVVFNAGTAIQKTNLVAESTIQLLADGTSSKTSEEIANELDYHGSVLETNLNKDTSSLTLYSLNKHLPKIIPLIFDIISNPVFTENELDNYIGRKRNQFLLNIDRVKYKAMLEFNKLVFGPESAYGKVKSIDDYNIIDRNELISFHKQHFNTNKTYIVVSDKINEKLLTLINRYFGRLRISNTHIQNEIRAVDRVEKPIYRFVKKENALQSAVRVGQHIVGYSHPDHNSLVLLNTILGGYFGSRLMSNIRENKGYTYGINSFLMNYKHGSYWCISTEVNAKHTLATLDELKIEIDRLRTEKVSDSELKLVKNYIYGTYLRMFDGPLAKADRFRSAYDLNFDFKDYTNNLNEIMRLTPDQIINIANKYFCYESMIKLVVGVLENDSFN